MKNTESSKCNQNLTKEIKVTVPLKFSLIYRPKQELICDSCFEHEHE